MAFILFNNPKQQDDEQRDKKKIIINENYITTHNKTK